MAGHPSLRNSRALVQACFVPERKNKKEKKNVLGIVLGVVGGAVFLLAIVAAAVWYLRSRFLAPAQSVSAFLAYTSTVR